LSELAATLVKAVVVFASTNVDDIVLLSVLFSDRTLRPRSIVVGQHLGIGLLVLASAVAGVAAVAVPPGWTALLGLVPLGLGLYKAFGLVRSRGQEEEPVPSKLASGSQVLAVIGVTVANGADNLSVYIPLFAAERRSIIVYAAVFGVLTSLWCVLGWALVNSPLVGRKLQRYGHVILPLVLVLLGLYIVAGARVLL
jgi:cadmium resistance protein CadD (predicted permease)